MSCLKPLCPDCIINHNKYHHERLELAQIYSVADVKDNCSKKVKSAINQLKIEIERCEL